jgi:hypothetical protein
VSGALLRRPPACPAWGRGSGSPNCGLRSWVARKRNRWESLPLDSTQRLKDSVFSPLPIVFFCRQNFDMNETFGAVTVADQLEGVIELSGRMNGAASVYEFALRVRVLYVTLRSTRREKSDTLDNLFALLYPSF